MIQCRVANLSVHFEVHPETWGEHKAPYLRSGAPGAVTPCCRCWWLSQEVVPLGCGLGQSWECSQRQGCPSALTWAASAGTPFLSLSGIPVACQTCHQLGLSACCGLRTCSFPRLNCLWAGCGSGAVPESPAHCWVLSVLVTWREVNCRHLKTMYWCLYIVVHFILS